NNGAAPSVNLPDGTFFARGAGGQYAFVIPAHDLVVVHRAPHSERNSATLRAVGRLLWLMLDAGKFADIGPDASLEAAQGIRLAGRTLFQMLVGKALLYGEAATMGPYRVRLNATGTSVFLRGRDKTEADTGTWSIREDKFFREWKQIEPRRMCMAV